MIDVAAISKRRATPLFETAVLVRGGGRFQRNTQTYNTRVESKVRSLANLAAASAICQPAAAARRSQARRGAHPPQDAWVHLWLVRGGFQRTLYVTSRDLA